LQVMVYTLKSIMLLYSNYLFCTVQKFTCHLCRIRVENVLLKSCVLSEVQRSLLNGGMHVEDLPPISHSGSSHLGQHMLPSDSPDRFRETNSGIGGPAGLWHFIYRSIYLDQYVSSEFPSSINTPQLQKRHELL